MTVICRTGVGLTDADSGFRWGPDVCCKLSCFRMHFLFTLFCSWDPLVILSDPSSDLHGWAFGAGLLLAWAKSIIPVEPSEPVRAYSSGEHVSYGILTFASQSQFRCQGVGEPASQPPS